MRAPHLVLALTFALAITQSAGGATNGLDGQFGSGGVVLLGATPVSALNIERVAGLAIQDDGKIVIGGRFNDALDGVWLAAIGRLNADGSWDTSFGDHGLFVLPYGAASAPNGGQVDRLAVLSDHSVIASGSALVSGGGYYSCTLLVKVDNTGTLSTTFAPDQSGSFCYDFAPSGFYFLQHLDALAVDASDTFYVTSPSTNLDHGAVAHFDSNGALLTGWGNNGVSHLPSGIFADLLQLTSNDLYAVGVTASNSEIGVVRIDANGALALTYGSKGIFSFDQLLSPGQVGPMYVALDSQQKLVIADNDYDGSQTPPNLPYRFARLTDAGALDTTFNGSGQQPGYPGFALPSVSGESGESVVAAIPLPDGHLLATGNNWSYGSPSNLALLRLNQDSGYDDAFGDAAHPGWTSMNILGTPTSSMDARALAVDTSGRVLISIDVGDGAIGCPGLIRVVADRLFDGHFDSPAVVPYCP